MPPFLLFSSFFCCFRCYNIIFRCCAAARRNSLRLNSTLTVTLLQDGLLIIFSIFFLSLLIIPGMPGYLSFQSRVALFVWIFIGIAFYFVIRKSYIKG